MTKLNQIYKCSKCGNIVEVVHGWRTASLLRRSDGSFWLERLEDQGKEKHVPVIEKRKRAIKLRLVPYFILWKKIIISSGLS